MSLNEEIVEIIKTSKTIAVVGISRNPEKAAHGVPKYLQSQGYKIVPINPKAKKILGEKAYPSLLDIPFEVDIIDVFRPSEETPAVVEIAVKIKPKLIWLQLGISNEKAKEIAEKQNIHFVMNKCLKVEHMKITGKI
jgi:predicted CoA-binding protein